MWARTVEIVIALGSQYGFSGGVSLNRAPKPTHRCVALRRVAPNPEHSYLWPTATTLHDGSVLVVGEEGSELLVTPRTRLAANPR